MKQPMTSMFVVLLPLCGIAQEATRPDPPKKARPYAAAPLVMVSPAFGNGVGAMGLYFYRFSDKDTVSPPSSIAAMGAYSDSRDHERYPESGILADLSFNMFPESLGSITWIVTALTTRGARTMNQGCTWG